MQVIKGLQSLLAGKIYLCKSKKAILKNRTAFY